jgi:transcription elongation factor Elf1
MNEEDERRAQMRAAALRRHNNCSYCGAAYASDSTRDGSEVGGLPGIKYRVCNACGHIDAVKIRRKQENPLI